MSDKPEERVGLYADKDSVIIADGAKVTGFDKAAKATRNSTVSLKDAITDSESVNNNGNDNSGNYWYKKPVGIIILAAIAGAVVLAIEKIFF